MSLTQALLDEKAPSPTLGFTPALTSLQPEIAALDANDLEIVNLDIPAAVTTAMGCLTELAPYRAQLGTLPSHPVEALDKLDIYASALSQAHARFLVSEGSGGDLADASKRVVEIRGVLFAAANLLVHRKVIEGDKLGQLKGTVGFKNQGSDVLQLVEILRGVSAEGHTLVSSTELDEAEAAVRALMIAVGKREQAPQVQTAAADLRQRCFTLFVRAYDELRRSISYLRWAQEDVDTIIPSLYGGRSRKTKDDDVSPVLVTGPDANVVAPSNPRNDPNLPGANPFATT